MKVLVIGSGGREHALLEALQPPGTAEQRWVYPGSDRMNQQARVLEVEPGQDPVDAAAETSVDLAVIGPEQYLAEGMADRFRSAGIPCWGPDQRSARLETSKRFAKTFMRRHDIPTADFRVAESPAGVRAAISELPVVLKFSGLAAGKGVTVCESEQDVEEFLRDVYERRRFGDPTPVLVEERLEGPEVSIICAVCDGDYQMFPPARDYKPLLNGDRGPNTGGMGAVCSPDLLPEARREEIERTIIHPTLDGLREEELPYRGFLYFGLMLTESGPRVLEYNCRFGDPEAQALLPLLEGNWLRYLAEASKGTLNPDQIEVQDGWCVCVVLASRGYPRESGTDEVITGLTNVGDVRVYHAGSRRGPGGEFLASGGRVLAVVARGSTRERAVENVYEAVDRIRFEGMQYRTDIGRLHFGHPAPS